MIRGTYPLDSIRSLDASPKRHAGQAQSLVKLDPVGLDLAAKPDLQPRCGREAAPPVRRQSTPPTAGPGRAAPCCAPRQRARPPDRRAPRCISASESLARVASTLSRLASGSSVAPIATGSRVQDPSPSLNNHLTGVADRSRIPHSRLPASATAWPRSLKPAKLCLSLVEGRAAYAGPAANIPSPHRPNTPSKSQ